MHGRLKVRTTEQQQLLKQKEQEKKLAAYRHAMNQVVATRKAVPYDSATFELCAQILQVNPDVYTLWNYRKEVTLQQIEESNSKQHVDDYDEVLITFLDDEMRLTQQCLLSNPKSYSCWHHRYWLLDHHPEPLWRQEFILCTKYLSMDDRNFHCWDYRRLLLNKVGIQPYNELQFSTERLNDNFSNYSSWHYRSSIIDLDKYSAGLEMNLVKSALFTDPADSSAWFYLRWLLSHPAVTDEQKKILFDNLEQLFEMEPDSKWILIGKVWLSALLCVTDKTFVDKRHLYYQQLRDLDPLRKGQYEDYLKITEVEKTDDK